MKKLNSSLYIQIFLFLMSCYCRAASIAPTDDPSFKKSFLLKTFENPHILGRILSYVDLKQLPALPSLNRETNQLLQKYYYNLNKEKDYMAWEGHRTIRGEPTPLMVYTFNESLDQFIRFMGHVFYSLKFQGRIHLSDYVMSEEEYDKQKKEGMSPLLFAIHSKHTGEILSPAFWTEAGTITLVPNVTLKNFMYQAIDRIFHIEPGTEEELLAKDAAEFEALDNSRISRDIDPSVVKGNRMAWQILALLTVWKPYFSEKPLHKAKLNEYVLTDEQIHDAAIAAIMAIKSSNIISTDEEDTAAAAEITVVKRTPKLQYEIALQHLIIYLSVHNRLDFIHEHMANPMLPKEVKIVYANTLFEILEVDRLNAVNTLFPVPRFLLLFANSPLGTLDPREVMQYFKTYEEGRYPFPEVDLEYLMDIYCSERWNDEARYSSYPIRSGTRDGRRFSSNGIMLMPPAYNDAMKGLYSLDLYKINTRKWVQRQIAYYTNSKGESISPKDLFEAAVAITVPERSLGMHCGLPIPRAAARYLKWYMDRVGLHTLSGKELFLAGRILASYPTRGMAICEEVAKRTGVTAYEVERCLVASFFEFDLDDSTEEEKRNRNEKIIRVWGKLLTAEIRELGVDVTAPDPYTSILNGLYASFKLRHH